MIFHHLGIAVNSILDDKLTYLSLGYTEETAIYVDQNLGIKCQFFLHSSGPRIELVEALDGIEVLDPWLKGGSPIYHMGFEVEGGYQPTNALQIFPDTPAVAFGGRNVCFYLKKGRQLIEFIRE